MSNPLKKFVINLLWVRPGKVGGTEVFVRNLLDGFHGLKDEFEAWLFVSADNAETFEKYSLEDKRFHLLKAPVRSDNITKRILWQNFFMNGFLKKNGFSRCFSPVYDRPVLPGGISYIITMHDIQAYYYPQYHPLHEVVYSKMCWQSDSRTSKGVVAISEFVANDISKVYPFKKDIIQVIYNPVCVNNDDVCYFEELEEKYSIKENEYYYTVGQLIPHKNIPTLLKVMGKIDGSGLPKKLLISGINGNASRDILSEIRKNGLEEKVILTGYVSNKERNALYKNAKAFLFPSVFEGFGIPPVEAMMFGTPVITTKMTCIPEVTQGKANYVDDPYDVDEWIRVMQKAENHSSELDCSRYDLHKIAKSYLDYLRKVWDNG